MARKNLEKKLLDLQDLLQSAKESATNLTKQNQELQNSISRNSSESKAALENMERKYQEELLNRENIEKQYLGSVKCFNANYSQELKNEWSSMENSVQEYKEKISKLADENKALLNTQKILERECKFKDERYVIIDILGVRNVARRKNNI